jgi:hypothetical protein
MASSLLIWTCLFHRLLQPSCAFMPEPRNTISPHSGLVVLIFPSVVGLGSTPVEASLYLPIFLLVRWWLIR